MLEFIKGMMRQRGMGSFLAIIVIGTAFRNILILFLNHQLERWHPS